jgi:glycosyltransferase involved in cell wall biosynthesis
MEKFVCAFRGRRDSYQVPLALAEAGLLDQFVTDAYAAPILRALARGLSKGFREKVDSRFVDGIPIERVRCLWFTTLIEHLRHRLGCAPMVTYNKLDRHFSRAAACRAAQTKSDLFLYSPYAWEAFTASYPHTPRKVLFQYHPHPDTERRILAEDSARYPSVGESFSGTTFGQVPEALAQRERDVWKHADLIFCASTFTKQSLVEAGCDELRCRVVPYGVDVPAGISSAPPAEFRVLFVGSGGQRKGLHHLLLAWQRASLPATSKLTLVCRVIDRGIEQLLAAIPRMELRRSISQSELNRLYARSSLFVMPSLVEGFGQVYLEALANGCPILGTENSCLPDLGDESDGIFIVETGSVAALTAMLEILSNRFQDNSEMRANARTCATRYTWLRFRRGIRDYVVNNHQFKPE